MYVLGKKVKEGILIVHYLPKLYRECTEVLFCQPYYIFKVNLILLFTRRIDGRIYTEV